MGQAVNKNKACPEMGQALLVVPLTGIEPVRCFHRGILSPLRLPVPPQRHGLPLNLSHLTIPPRKSQVRGLTNPRPPLYNIAVIAKKAMTGSVLFRRPQRESPRLQGFRRTGTLQPPPSHRRDERRRSRCVKPQKSGSASALQSGWYHGRVAFVPVAFAREQGRRAVFLCRRPHQKKKGLYLL